MIHLGCAGWSLSRVHVDGFPQHGRRPDDPGLLARAHRNLNTLEPPTNALPRVPFNSRQAGVGLAAARSQHFVRS